MTPPPDLRAVLAQLAGLCMMTGAVFGSDVGLVVLVVCVALEAGRYVHWALSYRDRMNRRLQTMLEEALTELEAQDPEAVDRVLDVLKKVAR